jgi:hypothetical protein
MQRIRRIITALDEQGAGTFATIEDVQPLLAGIGYHGVWGWDEPQAVPVAGVQPYEPSSLFPGPGGVRISVIHFPGGDEPAVPVDPKDAERMRTLRAAGDRVLAEDHDSGMHATASIEVAIVIQGEISLVEEDEGQVRLQVGDIVVQNGTPHAWRDPAPEGCTIAYVVLGAERA